MNEVHGMRVKKLTAGGPVDDQLVEIEDAAPHVYLRLGTSGFPAVLTSDEARFLARALNAAARRISRPSHAQSGNAGGPRAGGLARAAVLSPERRSEIASTAAAARWAR
jgi:hypothetical protein